MAEQRRTIYGLETFLCNVTQAWMTDRACAINRTIARKIQHYIKSGIPVWALQEHLVNRMKECMQCEKFGSDNEVNEIIRAEVDGLLKEIEELYLADEPIAGKFERDRVCKREWYHKKKGEKKDD